jgi:hypothetical protein
MDEWVAKFQYSMYFRAVNECLDSTELPLLDDFCVV